MSIQDILRRAVRENKLDARVATVSTERFNLTFSEDEQWVRESIGFVEIRSEQYAVSFVRRYATNEQWLKHVFGGDWDFEDLQFEMLNTMYKAAKKWLANGGEGIWKHYLSHCLKTRLWDISTKDKRRKNNMRFVYLWDEEEYLFAINAITVDPYTAEEYDHTDKVLSRTDGTKAFTHEEAYQEINSLNQARAFLERLTERQRTIIAMRWEHIPNGKKEEGTYNRNIAKKLHISEKTLYNDLFQIQRAFAEYAENKDTREEEWLYFLKNRQRRSNARKF